MKYLVDQITMKDIDETTQTEYGIPAAVLMERAALAVAKEVRRLAGGRILAVCGTGNNGGDGVAAARILHEWGYDIHMMILGEAEHGTELFKAQLRAAEASGVPVCHGENLDEYIIVIDAIFGIGLTRPVGGIYADVIDALNRSEAAVLSVDIPSGVRTDDGGVESVAVRADVTVTFGYSKMGLMLHPGREYAGKVIVADIGFPKKLERETVFPAFTYGLEDLDRMPARKEYSNKGTYGKVLVAAGSTNMCGACFLSAKAAYRAGAGLVKILTAEENRVPLQTMLPEAILATYELSELGSASMKERVLAELSWADAVVVGPGMGRTAEAGLLFDMILENVKVPAVVDADALYHLARNPKYADKSGIRRLHLPDNLILTPHLKEASELFECPVPQIQKNIMGTALAATEGQHFTLVMKDARTVVTRDGQLYINDSGNSGMATAGSGDVLTGVIAALLARGMELYEAAVMGVYMHGLAGDAAAARLGKDACMAGDIIEGLSEIRQKKKEG